MANLAQGLVKDNYDQVLTKKSGTQPAGVEDGTGQDYTSGIVDSGSDATGEWVKFADGTQICTATVSLDYSFKSSTTYRYRMDGSFVEAFPKAFVDQPTLSFSFYGGLSAASENARITCRPYVFGDGSFAGWSMGGANTISYTDTVKLFAIGRWK